MIKGLKNQTAHDRFWNKNRAVVGCRGRGLGAEKLEKYHGTKVFQSFDHIFGILLKTKGRNQRSRF